MSIKINQSGFGHIGVVLLLLAVLVVVAGVGIWVVSQPSNSTQTNSGDKAEPVIALQNVGLTSMSSVLVTPEALREYDSMGLKGFYPFGDKLGGKSDPRLNPNFEFASLNADTKIVAAIDGIVAYIKEQPDTGDSEIFLQPKEGSQWTVGYDHITKPTVKKGDSVKAGDVIGQPAVQGNGALRFEIQINKDEAGTTTHFCPSSLLADNVRDVVLADLASMQQSWNSVTGRDLYNIDSQDPVGCLKKTLSTAEAEGR